MNDPLIPNRDSSVSHDRRVLPRMLAFGAMALIGLALLGAIGMKLWRRPEAPPILPTAQVVVATRRPFNLVDPTGRSVTDLNFRGKFTLVYFGYTTCQEHCPTMLAMTELALKKLGPRSDRLVPIFITVDPEHDTPEVMGHYTARFSQRILGLTGSESQIEAVENAYGHASQFRTTETGGYVIEHSANLYLVGPDGIFIAEIPTDGSADDLASLILRDMNTGQPGGDATSGP